MNLSSMKSIARRACSFGACCLVFIALFSVAVEAQNITVNSGLVFGSVLQGVPKTISKYTAGAAAEFYITGTNGKEVSIEFTLPTFVNKAGWNMPLVFGTTDASVDSRKNPDQSRPLNDNLNPWVAIIDRMGNFGLTVWLGGKLIPKANQLPGDYTATIVLTVTYTGN